MASPKEHGVVSIDGKRGATMGTHTERRRIFKEDLRKRSSVEKPHRLALEAIREIKQLETVQLKRWQKPSKKN